jgi:hypothetical protein
VQLSLLQGHVLRCAENFQITLYEPLYCPGPIAAHRYMSVILCRSFYFPEPEHSRPQEKSGPLLPMPQFVPRSSDLLLVSYGSCLFFVSRSVPPPATSFSCRGCSWRVLPPLWDMEGRLILRIDSTVPLLETRLILRHPSSASTLVMLLMLTLVASVASPFLISSG